MLLVMEDLEHRRAALRAAIADEWEYELRESPELATTIGDYRYNDRWTSPVSPSRKASITA